MNDGHRSSQKYFNLKKNLRTDKFNLDKDSDTKFLNL